MHQKYISYFFICSENLIALQLVYLMSKRVHPVIHYFHLLFFLYDYLILPVTLGIFLIIYNVLLINVLLECAHLLGH